jgi:hypothetical protein
MEWMLFEDLLELFVDFPFPLAIPVIFGSTFQNSALILWN